jgi:hypothetical protein
MEKIKNYASPKREKVAAPVATPLKEIEFLGIKYHFIDFDNEFTCRQDDCAMELVKELFTETFQNINQEDIQITEKENQNLIKKGLELITSNQLKSLYPKIFALFYLPQTEEMFNEKTYRDRIELFKDLPRKTVKDAGIIIENFFNLIIPSMLNDSLVSVNKIVTMLNQFQQKPS